MPFKDIFNILLLLPFFQRSKFKPLSKFNFGGHFVLQSSTVWAFFIEGLEVHLCEKKLNFGQ